MKDMDELARAIAARTGGSRRAAADAEGACVLGFMDMRCSDSNEDPVSLETTVLGDLDLGQSNDRPVGSC